MAGMRYGEPEVRTGPPTSCGGCNRYVPKVARPMESSKRANPPAEWAAWEGWVEINIHPLRHGGLINVWCCSWACVVTWADRQR